VPKIYISHQREDTSYAAKALYQALTNHYGRKYVFPKLDTTHAGKVLSPQVERMAAKCDIMLVLIGDRFLKPGSRKKSADSRLDDLIATAIRSAVRCNMPILTVLVGEIEMPTEDLLPVERAQLASDVPVRFRPKGHFRDDVEKLFERIDTTLPPKNSGLLGWLR
jgi:hypothetical protein